MGALGGGDGHRPVLALLGEWQLIRVGVQFIVCSWGVTL